MIQIKKIAALSLAFLTAFSSFGCFDHKEEETVDHTDEILDTADDFCSDIKSLAIDKAIKLSDDEVAESLSEISPLLVFEEGDIYNAEAAMWAAAVAETIDYSIDEDSVSVSSKKAKGTVEVTFTIADHGSVTSSDQYTDLDSMLQALEETDNVEISVVLEVVYDDDKWVISYCDELVEELFDFTEVRELSFGSGLSDHINIVITEAVSNGESYEYYNSSYINFSVNFDSDAEFDKSDIHYIVYYNGTEVYASDLTDYGEDEHSFIIMYTVLDQNGPADRSLTLPDGYYSIVVYYGEEEIYTFDCECITGEPPATYDLATQVGLIDFIDDIAFAYLYDDVDLDRSGWYLGDERIDGVYSASLDNLCFRLYVGSDHGDLGCNLYYSPEAIVPQPAIPNMYLIGQEDNSVTVGPDGSYYYEIIVSGDIGGGFYILTIDDTSYLEPDATQVVFACCSVE